MSEWPKQVAESDLDRWGGGNYVSVVPADLARELYEELREADANRDPTGGLDYKPCPALARYEREVGK